MASWTQAVVNGTAGPEGTEELFYQTHQAKVRLAAQGSKSTGHPFG